MMSVDGFTKPLTGFKRKKQSQRLSEAGEGAARKKFKKSNSGAKSESKKSAKGKQKLNVRINAKPKEAGGARIAGGQRRRKKNVESTLVMNDGLVIKCEPADAEFDALNQPHSSSSVFISANQWQERIRKTKPRKPATCTSCQKVFCSANSLKRHNQAVHSAENVPMSCSLCDAIFTKVS
jgi:hypothetical protein